MIRIRVAPILTYTLSWCLFSSCNSDKATDTNILDLGQFSISVPSTWQPVRQEGIDSFVGQIALTDGDTIFFDLGWYSNPLEEELAYNVENGNVYLLDRSRSTSNSQIYDFYGKLDTVDLEKSTRTRLAG